MKQFDTAWEAVVAYLQQIETDYVFGLPSDDLNQLRALRNSNIRFILSKDQRNSVFMAAGYSLVTGKPGVCAIGKGPALTNSLTGLLEAKTLGVPLIILGVGIANHQVGTKAFQEADQMALVQPVVKWSYRVEHVDRLIWALEKGAYLATNGCLGPVYIEIPDHLSQEKIDYVLPFHSLQKNKVLPGKQELEESLKLLNNAKKPILLLGGGCSHIHADLERFADQLGAAVFTTASGRGSISENHKHYCGLAGLYTARSFRVFWDEADLIVVLGSRLEETALFPWGEQNHTRPVIQVNIEPYDFNHSFSGMKLVGEVGEVITEWSERIVQGENRSDWLKLIRKQKEESMKEKEMLIQEAYNSPDIKVIEILQQIQSLFPQDSIMVQENGLQDMWSYFYPRFILGHGGQIVTPSEQTSLGFGAAAAMGVALGKPEQCVIALVGDGAFNLCKSDLITALEQKLSLIYIVLNNGGYGWLQYQLQQHHSEINDYAFTSDFFIHPSNETKHSYYQQIVIKEKEELTEGFLEAYQAYQQGKLVVVHIQVELSDIPPEIEGVYGEFPVIEPAKGGGKF